MQYEPVVTEGNEAYVHHLLLYGCWNLNETHLRDSNRTHGRCYTSEMPENSDSCRMLSYAWAIGGTVSIDKKQDGSIIVRIYHSLKLGACAVRTHSKHRFYSTLRPQPSNSVLVGYCYLTSIVLSIGELRELNRYRIDSFCCVYL